MEAPSAEVKEAKSKRKKNGSSHRKKKYQDKFKYMLCVDFEATCWEKADQAKWKVQEIIEFPAVLVDLKTGQICDEFREYLKPREFPTLSDFCVNLTNISQQTVNQGISIEECLTRFDAWIKKVILTYQLQLPKMRENDQGNCVLATWTVWDSICLSKECSRKKIKKPSYFGQWCDVREIFMKRYLHKPVSFAMALKHVGLTFEGTQHSGLDDARNLARLVYKMRQEGAQFYVTRDNNPYHRVNKPF